MTQTGPVKTITRQNSLQKNEMKILAVNLPTTTIITARKEPGSTNNPGNPPRPKHGTVKTRTQTNYAEIRKPNNQLISERIQKQLNIKLGFKRQYPLLAIRNAWQGKVNLGIRIQANGRLTDVHVIESSGYHILDNAAISSVHKVASLPEAVYWLDGNYIDVILPVIYKLTES